MIKKFVSKALLSVFMDKKARKTLDASRAVKSKNSAPIATTPKDDSDADVIQRVTDPLTAMSHDEVTALIRESLDAAEHEIVEKKTKPVANPNRQALIDQALAVHRSKSHIIDELPDEQREKLVYMATQALGARLKGGK